MDFNFMIMISIFDQFYLTERSFLACSHQYSLIILYDIEPLAKYCSFVVFAPFYVNKYHKHDFTTFINDTLAVELAVLRHS